MNPRNKKDSKKESTLPLYGGLAAAIGGLGSVYGINSAIPAASVENLKNVLKNTNTIYDAPTFSAGVNRYADLMSSAARTPMFGTDAAYILKQKTNPVPFDAYLVDDGTSPGLNILKKLIPSDSGRLGISPGFGIAYDKNPLLPFYKNIKADPSKDIGIFKLAPFSKPDEGLRPLRDAAHYDNFAKGPLHARLTLINEAEGDWWNREDILTSMKNLVKEKGDAEKVTDLDIRQLFAKIPDTENREAFPVPAKYLTGPFNKEQTAAPLNDDFVTYFRKFLKTIPTVSDADTQTLREDVDYTENLLPTFSGVKNHASALSKSLGFSPDLNSLSIAQQSSVLDKLDGYLASQGTQELQHNKEFLDFIAGRNLFRPGALGDYENIIQKTVDVHDNLVLPGKALGYGVGAAGVGALGYYLHKKLQKAKSNLKKDN